MLHATLLLGALSGTAALRAGTPLRGVRRSVPMMTVETPTAPSGTSSPDAISAERPLHVLIAGAGVGGLALANSLELSNKHVTYTVLE